MAASKASMGLAMLRGCVRDPCNTALCHALCAHLQPAELVCVPDCPRTEDRSAPAAGLFAWEAPACPPQWPAALHQLPWQLSSWHLQTQLVSWLRRELQPDCQPANMARLTLDEAAEVLVLLSRSLIQSAHIKPTCQPGGIGM